MYRFVCAVAVNISRMCVFFCLFASKSVSKVSKLNGGSRLDEHRSFAASIAFLSLTH